MGRISTIAEMDLSAGVACLDLVNTALDFEVSVERLHTYQDLLMLTRRLTLLDEATLVTLEQLAQANPEQAERSLLDARYLRQSMQTVFAALVKGELESLPAGELDGFNRHITEALGHRRFLGQAAQLALGWRDAPAELPLLAWAFSLSAYGLLTQHDQRLIKQCGSCGWYFLDATKNHGRKWCDMQTCGASQKARRYYQRTKLA